MPIHHGRFWIIMKNTLFRTTFLPQVQSWFLYVLKSNTGMLGGNNLIVYPQLGALTSCKTTWIWTCVCVFACVFSLHAICMLQHFQGNNSWLWCSIYESIYFPMEWSLQTILMYPKFEHKVHKLPMMKPSVDTSFYFKSLQNCSPSNSTNVTTVKLMIWRLLYIWQKWIQWN